MSTRFGSTDRPTDVAQPRRLTAPGIVLGVGLGGFVDGIVLHQILQWHHMLTSTDTDHVGIKDYPADTVRGLEMNTLWDGLFHAFTWVMVLVGLVLLSSRARRTHGRVWSTRRCGAGCWSDGASSTWSRAFSCTTSSASTTCAPVPTSWPGTWGS